MSLTTFLYLEATRSIILPTPPPSPIPEKNGMLVHHRVITAFCHSEYSFVYRLPHPQVSVKLFSRTLSASCCGIVAIKKRFTSFPLAPLFSILSTKSVGACGRGSTWVDRDNVEQSFLSKITTRLCRHQPCLESATLRSSDLKCGRKSIALTTISTYQTRGQ